MAGPFPRRMGSGWWRNRNRRRADHGAKVGTRHPSAVHGRQRWLLLEADGTQGTDPTRPESEAVAGSLIGLAPLGVTGTVWMGLSITGWVHCRISRGQIPQR